jgi:hypothetical protein
MTRTPKVLDRVLYVRVDLVLDEALRVATEKRRETHPEASRADVVRQLLRRGLGLGR